MTAQPQSIPAPGRPFRFDASRHTYTDLATGEELPHATGILETFGYIDSRFYPPEAAIRGQRVHALTAAYDLGSLERPESLVDAYKGYLAAHVALVGQVKPTWLAVEEPFVHSRWLFGTRPDRVCQIHGLLGVLDEKSGGPEPWHGLQTAFQALAVAEAYRVPEAALGRWTAYLEASGKYRLVQHQRLSVGPVAVTQHAKLVRRCIVAVARGGSGGGGGVGCCAGGVV